jgi:hypothetical protein
LHSGGCHLSSRVRATQTIHPIVVPLSRQSSRLSALSVLLFYFTLIGAACADKGSAGASATTGGTVPGDSGKGAPRATPAPAVVGIQAVNSAGKRVAAGGSTTGPTVEEERKAVEVNAGALPSRPRQDSVALASMTKGDSALDKLWPVKMPAPLPGALLPHNRIVAYYGNPLSKKMGVLGEYPKDQMLAMLDKEVAKWAKADPSHPVIPALHLIATVAQGAPGKNGLYRLQMRDSMVNDIYSWIKAKNGVFFIDVQVGKSTLQAELPRLRPFLENPDVHLAVDPEFSMAPSGAVPGTKIGTLDAKDINWAVNFLDEIAKSKNLPPKILIVHRFTRKMVTNASEIRYTPHVQVVMDMDGWGPPWLKFDSYHDYIKKEPVQFTGFKLFYHNDTKKGAMLTPAEVLRLNPKPLYIQYQ